MDNLRIFLFKNSYEPFTDLLRQNDVSFERHDPRAGGTVFASGFVVEIIQSTAMWGALATVVVAFINSRRARKVIITTKEGTVVHAEGLSPNELQKVLEEAKNLTAIDSESTSSNDPIAK
jgi:hypothetical protein